MRDLTRVITNKELSLMLVIKKVFNQSCHMLCMRHIDQNIVGKLTPTIGEDVTSMFINSTRHNIINSNNEVDFNERLEKMKVKWRKRPNFVHYLFDI